MAGQAEPLILNSKAARRLQLLFSHGARPQPASSARAQDGATQLCLAAGILQEPVPAGQAGGRSQEWLLARDTHAEVAVHIDTLRALKVGGRERVTLGRGKGKGKGLTTPSAHITGHEVAGRGEGGQLQPP